jgi:hypothetical protein
MFNWVNKKKGLRKEVSIIGFDNKIAFFLGGGGGGEVGGGHRNPLALELTQ